MQSNWSSKTNNSIFFEERSGISISEKVGTKNRDLDRRLSTCWSCIFDCAVFCDHLRHQGQFVIHPRLLFSIKRKILNNVIKSCDQRRATKAPVELWVKRVSRRVLRTAFYGNLCQKKFPTLPISIVRGSNTIKWTNASSYTEWQLRRNFTIKSRGTEQHEQKWRALVFWEISTVGVFFQKQTNGNLLYVSNERGMFHLSNELLLSWMRDYAARQAKNQFCPESKCPPGTLWILLAYTFPADGRILSDPSEGCVQRRTMIKRLLLVHVGIVFLAGRWLLGALGRGGFLVVLGMPRCAGTSECYGEPTGGTDRETKTFAG